MPFALATASAPARTARAIGLPALLVKTPMVSAAAGESPNGSRPVIAAASQAPWYLIRFPPGLPAELLIFWPAALCAVSWAPSRPLGRTLSIRNYHGLVTSRYR